MTAELFDNITEQRFIFSVSVDMSEKIVWNIAQMKELHSIQSQFIYSRNKHKYLC